MKWKYFLIPITILFFTLTSPAQNLIRGPYLQMGTPNSMIIRWRTGSPISSKVWYGVDPANLDAMLSQAGARTEHEINLTGLTPNTTYYYAVGSDSGPLEGPKDDYYFTTSPTHGESKPVSIWVLGDAGKRTASQRAVRDAFYDFNGSPHTDLILLLGDNAYNDGTDAEYQEAWFENMYENSLSNSVMWPTIGNHDAINADSDTESGPYYDIFNCPREGEAGGTPSGTEAWYSFDYANIHFISLNTEDVDDSANSPMLAWLKNDLAATRQEWIVTFFHKQPYYTVSNFRREFLPVLEAAGVDLVLYGHRHIYRRSILMNGHYGSEGSYDATTMAVDSGDGRSDGDGVYQKPPGNTPNAGTVYLVSGSAGSVSNINTSYPFSSFELGSPELGSTYISVNGSQMDVQFINHEGLIRDYFTISKGVGSRPNVSIINPADGTSYPSLQTINIAAEASDSDGQIAQVEFFANGASIGIDQTAPFSLDWSVPSKDIYDLHVVATDNDDNIAHSAKITIEAGVFSACSSIIASGDDAEQALNTGSIKLTSSDLELGVESTQLAGLRFQNLNIPQNAQIISASLQFVVDETIGVDPCTLRIYGEASGNSAPFANAAYELSNRPRTQSVVSWSPEQWTHIGDAGSDQRIELASIIQEIVNQAAYESNSAIALMIEGSGSRIAQSFDKNPANAPQLCIVYAQNDSGFDCAATGANIGDPCDDNDVCTVNDQIQADCKCGGTPAPDSDEDGICDQLDQCADQPEPGSPCDDGNANTYDDSVGEDCICRGVPIPYSGVLQIPVGNQNDDVEERMSDGVLSLTSSDLELGYEKQEAQMIGIRFNDIILPQASEITKAYIQFTLDEPSSGKSSLLIQGEDIDNAPTFTKELFNASARARTTASASWEVPNWNAGENNGPAQRTVNISNIVQEIVDRPGWKVQNSMVFLINGLGTRTAKSYDDYSSGGPVLIIEYDNTDRCLSAETACDDNNPCTENDVFDADCNCAGTLRDSDNDGVCDDLDLCPGGDDAVDNNGNGTPDACDPCEDSMVGASCDDGDPNTINDIIDAHCNCSGTSASLSVLDISVNKRSDDVEEREHNGAVNFYSRDLELVHNRGNQTVGIRFNNISLPPGALIKEAYVQFTADKKSKGKAELLLEGQDIDNAPRFSRANFDVSARSRTRAAVKWTPAPWNKSKARGEEQRTANIASVIQEIVNRSGWEENNSIVIIISGEGKRKAESYDGRRNQGPTLHIEYFPVGHCPEAGTPCDDGDACTVDDAYDEHCNCAGTYPGEGVIGQPQSEDCKPCSNLYVDDFENGWGNWKRGGRDSHLSDRFARSGSRSVRLRDNSGRESSAFTKKLDLRAYKRIEISFSYYPYSMDNEREDFWLQMSTDNGRTYETIEEWNLSDEFSNGRWYEDKAVVSGVTFSKHTRFRFVCDASTNFDQVYLDDIVIAGCGKIGSESTQARIADQEEAPESESAAFPKQSDKLLQLEEHDWMKELKLRVKPNPFQEEFYLFIQKPASEIQTADVQILDVNGQTVYQQSGVPLGQDHLIVPQNGWPKGVYFVRVQTNEYLQTIKLIKQ